MFLNEVIWEFRLHWTYMGLCYLLNLKTAKSVLQHKAPAFKKSKPIISPV
jgi:hypothetical protein